MVLIIYKTNRPHNIGLQLTEFRHVKLIASWEKTSYIMHVVREQAAGLIYTF